MSILVKVTVFLIISFLIACSSIQLNNLVEIKDISPSGRSAKDFYPYELDADGRSKGSSHVNLSYRVHSGDAIELTAEEDKKVNLDFHISGDRDNSVIDGNSRIRVPVALFLIGNQVGLKVDSHEHTDHEHTICLFKKKDNKCPPSSDLTRVRCLNSQSSWTDIQHMIIEGGCGINATIGSDVEVTSGCKPNGKMIACGDINISVKLLPVEQAYLFPGDRFYLEVVARNEDEGIPLGLVHTWPYAFPAQVDGFGYAYLPRMRNGSELAEPNNSSDVTKIPLKRIAETTTGNVNSRIRIWWPGGIMGKNSISAESQNALPDVSTIARCLAMGETTLPLNIDQCTRLDTDLSRIYPKTGEFERVSYHISPMDLTWILVDEEGHRSEIKYVFGTTLYHGVATHYSRLTGQTLLRPEFGLDRNTAYLTVVPNVYRAEAESGQNEITAGNPFFVEISRKHKPTGSTNTLIWPGDTVFVTREQPCCAN